MLFAVCAAAALSGCATLTNDAYMPIALSFSDNSEGHCVLENERGIWEASLPGRPMIRRDDEPLKYRCDTTDGRKVVGQIESSISAKIVASAVFLDLGITDAITDMHREYPASYVIPIRPAQGGADAY